VNKKPFIAIFVLSSLLLLMTSMIPVYAWNNTDYDLEWYAPYIGLEDTKFEQFGPRADKILIKLYENAEGEWDALRKGEIDVTDWPLTKPYWTLFNTDPQCIQDIEKKYYGAEFGIRILDINNNNDTELAPGYSNPVCPNPLGPTNDPNATAFRRALWHLTDRETWFPIIIGAGFYAPLYSTHGPSYGEYAIPALNPYPYDPVTAAALLETHGFPWKDDGDGKMEPGERYWDRDKDGVKDPTGEDLSIKFMIRSDDIHRLSIGRKLADEMNAVGIAVERTEGPIAVAREKWMYGKTVHLYTAGWGLGVDPDHTILWETDYYWHPGSSYNTGKVSNASYDAASKKVVAPNTKDEAIAACHLCQNLFNDFVGGVPFFAYAGTMAVRRRYTGGNNEVIKTPDDGENAYRGKYWSGFVNVPGYGADSFWTFLNLHPMGYAYGTGPGAMWYSTLTHAASNAGNMTIRYGFKTAELKSFNPVYAEWTWEWIVLGLMYDTLLARNPYNLAEFMPWMAKTYEVGIYKHPSLGPCTKVRFSLRPDMTWSDGYAVTMADLYFTWVELDALLKARGLPPSWNQPTFAHILSFSILDPCTAECLLDMKSIYGVAYPGGAIILPKHIWKPLAETGPIQNMDADPNMICNGPYRFVEYVAFSHVLMAANKPGVTVRTSHGGSVPITSPYGYFRYYPVYVDVHPLIKFENTTAVPVVDGKVIPELGSKWHEIKGPEPCTIMTLTNWIDNKNGYLDQSDYINMTTSPYVSGLYHVFMVEVIDSKVYIKVDWWTQKIPPSTFKMTVQNATVLDIMAPVSSQWKETTPVGVREWHLSSWDGPKYVGDYLNASDQIDMYQKAGGNESQIHWFHVDAISYNDATHIWTMNLTSKPAVEIGVTLHNLIQEQYLLMREGPPPIPPLGSEWIEIRPDCNPPNRWIITSASDAELSHSDQIDMEHLGYPGMTEWFHVEWVIFNGTHTFMEVIPKVVVNKYVYIIYPNGTRVTLVDDEEIHLAPCKPYKEEFNIPTAVKCNHTVEVKIHIKKPNWDSWKLYCKWINYTFRFWVTIPPDISGGLMTCYDTAPIHPTSAKQIPTPDCKVDMKDVYEAAKAFGSRPGDIRWSVVADINLDYKVDMKDIYAIARNFGYKC